MKELGQSLVKGAVLLLGFLILIVALSSLPGGNPASEAEKDPTVQSQAQPSVPTPSAQRVPSAVRGASSPAPAPVVTPAQPDGSQPVRSRLNRPRPVETEAEMHRRISSFLDRN